jgi:hypothetical protein
VVCPVLHGGAVRQLDQRRPLRCLPGTDATTYGGGGAIYRCPGCRPRYRRRTGGTGGQLHVVAGLLTRTAAAHVRAFGRRHKHARVCDTRHEVEDAGPAGNP